MKIELGKQYRTRDGREVRIYAVDGGGDWPVHGAYMHGDTWRIISWTAEGSVYSHKTDTDLIEVPPRIKRKVWVNVYRTMSGIGAHYSKDQADEAAFLDRIACVEIDIDVEEGHGL